MKRTFNYTERKSIAPKDVRIFLKNAGDKRRAQHAEFDAELNISEYKLHPNSKVVIEAYRQNSWMSFDWGTVGNLTPQSDRFLRAFESPEDILFRVKVISATRSGLLEAEADTISPSDAEDEDSDRSPLLPVMPQDLGDEIWRLDFSDNRTRLLIHSAIGDIRSKVLSPEFRSLVYPVVIRIILEKALLHKDNTGDLPSAGEPNQWDMRWVRFCSALPGSPNVNPYTCEDGDDRQEWIEDVLTCFCRLRRVRDEYINHCEGSTQ